MKKAREVDILMAQRVLGHSIYYEKSGAIREKAHNGQSRPLRSYSTDISAAWELVEKLGMTLIPVAGGWFALVGPKAAWDNPAEFLAFLQKGDFVNGGAAVGESAPLTVCMAALKVLEKRDVEAAGAEIHEGADESSSEAPLPH